MEVQGMTQIALFVAKFIQKVIQINLVESVLPAPDT